MKRLILTIALSGLFIVQTLSAQEPSLRERISRREAGQKDKSIPQLTIRAENMNQSQTQDIATAPWMREIYRFIDLEKEENASLYYPVLPIEDRMNLFTMIFKLLSNNEITAYDFFLDGREIFTEENKLKFNELLDTYGIMYREENGKLVVQDNDIPSNEITGYYLKEAWYFDKSNSVVDVKTLAISPVLIRQDDFGIESTRYPLFWLPYEEIRPYAARMPIMLSNLNNASTQTIDDFFRKRSFDGEIYKTTNMKNLTLAQIFPSDTLVKKEQKVIEAQLKQFNSSLWAVNDSVQIAENTKGKKKDKKKKDSSDEDDSEVKVRTNEKKTSDSKSSSSSTPVRSMRGRRSR